MKTVTVYSCCTHGMGDFYAGLHILDMLLKENGLQLHWIVKSQQPKMRQKIDIARQKFPAVNIIHIIPQEPDALALSGGDFMAALWELNRSLSKIKNIDLLIVVPNVTEIKNRFLYNLFSEHAKKILLISEYDYHPGTFHCHIMGLGEESRGILIPELPSNPTINSLELQKLSGLQGFDVSAPYFFGYVNNEEAPANPGVELSFVHSAMIIADLESHAHCQLVANIPFSVFEKEDHPFITTLKKWGGVIEYHHGNGNTQVLNYSEEKTLPAVKIFKIFNPFPLPDEQFKILMHCSHILTMATGDQSLMQSLFDLKCVVYQAMNWKLDLAIAFLHLVKKICGKKSEYHVFMKAVILHGNLDDCIQKQWNANTPSNLQSDALKITNFIRQHKDFSKVFSKLVANALQCENKKEVESSFSIIQLLSTRFSALETQEESQSDSKREQQFFKSSPKSRVEEGTPLVSQDAYQSEVKKEDSSSEEESPQDNREEEMDEPDDTAIIHMHTSSTTK